MNYVVSETKKKEKKFLIKMIISSEIKKVT